MRRGFVFAQIGTATPTTAQSNRKTLVGLTQNSPAPSLAFGSKNFKIMSEETENQVPAEKPVAPKPAKPAPPKRPSASPFAPKNNFFSNPKKGNSSKMGKVFKGGGMKKGK